MADYLGVTAYLNDQGLYSSVSGTVGPFEGLGPYSLSLPFNDFSDVLTSGNGGQDALTGSNGKFAEITKGGYPYKTAFWALAWEALPPTGGLRPFRFFWIGAGNLRR